MCIRVFITVFVLFFSSQIFSQSDEDLVRLCIQNYFNGTAYNRLEQIDTAFYHSATLYLENREGELMKLSPAEYISFFENGKAGEFSGRYSKILSIEVEGNLAQVSAEILYPARKRRYLDVFIVREMEEGLWQIVSKAANSRPMDEE